MIKLPAQDDAVRDRVVIGYRSECAFYASVADRVRVPTPQCFYCEITDDAMEYALLLADQAPAVQGDQIAGCGEQEARLAVVALAGLHGPSWCDPFWLDLPGLAFPRPDEASAKGLGDVAKMSADITLEKLGDRMTAEDRETFTTTMGLVTPWLLAEHDRFALMHGDYRLDNLLFDPDHTLGERGRLADARRRSSGAGSRVFHCDEPGFAAACGNRESLVDDYHRALLGYGVTGYDRETCWRDYRLGVPQAPADLGAGVRLRRRHRTRRRHGADHARRGAVRRSAIWGPWN